MENNHIKQEEKQPLDNKDPSTNNNQPDDSYLQIPPNLPLRCQRVYGWDAAFTERAIAGYQQFMTLKQIQQQQQQQQLQLPGGHTKWVLPPPVVHRVWQQHLLDVGQYVTACRDYCDGMILEHHPEDDDPLVLRAALQQQQQQNTNLQDSQNVGQNRSKKRRANRRRPPNSTAARMIQNDNTDMKYIWESRIRATQELWKETFPSLPASSWLESDNNSVWSYQHAPDSSLLFMDPNQKVKSKKESDNDNVANGNNNDHTKNGDYNTDDDDDDDEIEDRAARKRRRRTRVSPPESGTDPLTIVARRYHQTHNNNNNNNNNYDRPYSDLYFRILPTTKMSKLFAKFVEHDTDLREQLLEQQQQDDGRFRRPPVLPPMTFFFQNRIVQPKDTAHSLGMMDSDMMVVSQSAFID